MSFDLVQMDIVIKMLALIDHN